MAAKPTLPWSHACWHVLRIALSFSLIFLDNTILFFTALLAYFPYLPYLRLRQKRNVRFYPKTILITGIGTPHGLKLARAWAAEGHRVIGADVTDLDLPIRSGGSMSKALVAFYRIPKDHYISRILDVINREKVDIWIPCSPKATSIEDATARQMVESRTGCKCITFDENLAICFAGESFTKFVTERGLPVLEYHRVQSRDSVHKILHRSPSKSYRISRATPTANDRALLLPRRTISKTYTCLSEIQITQERPWILQQQFRLGEVFADLLIVRGQVQAIKVRLSDAGWGSSRLDQALSAAIQTLMQSLATKCGTRSTGHLTVRLMIDEEFDAHSVRHSIYIAGCSSGAKVIENLLHDIPCPVAGYLSVFPSNPVDSGSITASLSSTPPKKFAQAAILPAAFLHFSLLHFVLTLVEVAESELVRLLFWRDPLFTPLDPLPWWWEVHVYRPLREVWMMVKQTREAGLKEY
ncbi:unnamed protein product [Penicillium salamii]|uniref:Uncharacterized protein n=1 Tax=Penicillium salamii TaxID=1612424 RepID=A0A9W4NK49_9EURO|nr:unnamed protein product [Penicillium salamii]